MKRIPKEWDEKCLNCHGTGTVHRRQHFALWTPEEYDIDSTLNAKYMMPSDAYKCTVVPGSNINDAIKEGIELAHVVHTPVAFELNGVAVICRKDSDAESLFQEWWNRMYGKTYEQSMDER